MKTSSFVREECANHMTDGSCIGAKFDDHLRHRGFTPRSKCLVIADKRCQYFEECVMPLADIAEDPQHAADWRGAVAAYRRKHNLGLDEGRACPGCGEKLTARKRICPACFLKARKEAARRGMRSKRQNAPCPVNS